MIPRILLTLVTIVFILLCNVACNDVDRGTQKRVGIINDLTGLKTVIEMDVIDNLYTNSTTFIGECQPNIKTNSGFRMLQREIEHLWINPGLSNWIASANLKANTNLAFIAKYRKGTSDLLIGINFKGQIVEGEQLANQLHEFAEIWKRDEKREHASPQ